MKKINLFENIPETLPDELIEILSLSENVRIERIVSQGQCSAEDFYYEQAQDEFVLVLKGMAELEFSDAATTIALTEGDCIIIPAHQRHRVNWTAPDKATIWLTVFY